MTTCADIPGATGATYTAVSADVGSRLRSVVTATNAASSASQPSLPTGLVAALAPASTGQPTVTGTTVAGDVLTAGHGTFSGTTPLTYAYQWRRCDADGTTGCADVPGQTGATYTT